MLDVKSCLVRARLVEDLMALAGVDVGVPFLGGDEQFPLSGSTFRGGFAVIGAVPARKAFFASMESLEPFDATQILQHLGSALDVEGWDTIVAWPLQIRIGEL